MISRKVYKLKKDTTLETGLEFKSGQEIEIVADVVYMGGHLIPPNLQNKFYNWLTKNPDLFTDETRNW